MNLNELKDFFNNGVKLPAMFMPEPAISAPDVPRFINECIREIEYPNSLQRIKDIRLRWLIKLKEEIENAAPDNNPDNLYVIKTSLHLSECFKLEFAEYEALRDKIKSRLLKYYETVTFKDAGLESYDINFYCQIGSHGAMQSFNAEEWINIERNGDFENEWVEILEMIEFQSGWAKK